MTCLQAMTVVYEQVCPLCVYLVKQKLQSIRLKLAHPFSFFIPSYVYVHFVYGRGFLYRNLLPVLQAHVQIVNERFGEEFGECIL
jgi:hypothetical protein